MQFPCYELFAIFFSVKRESRQLYFVGKMSLDLYFNRFFPGKSDNSSCHRIYCLNYRFVNNRYHFRLVERYLSLNYVINYNFDHI